MVSLGLVYLAILLNILVKRNVFMLGIGWLAVYTAAEGWRALLRSKGRLPAKPQRLDLLLAGTTTLLSVALVLIGGRILFVSSNLMGLVCAGFGLLGLFLVHATWKRWRQPPDPRQWLVVHIGMMTGAFSATLTAFFAVQFSGHLGAFEWVVWVGPTLFMTRYAAYETKRRGLSGTPWGLGTTF